MYIDIHFLLGECALYVHGIQTLLECLPRDWERYRIDAVQGKISTTELYIDDCLNEEVREPGWSFGCNGNRYEAIYCDGSLPLFQLQYIKNERTVIWLHASGAVRRSLSLGFQYATMVAFSETCIGLHGVTVICGSKAIILSAPSGTGKTTLAKLLQMYCEAAIVNGDFALLSCSPENGVVFEPTPFCGSSKTCHNYRLPISHIVFLEQAERPYISRLSAREALRLMLNNTFVPHWDENVQNDVQSTVTKIVGRIPISRFCLPPTEEAANMLFSYINS